MSLYADNLNWTSNIYLLETTDPVQGGPNGISNQATKELSDRTALIKNGLEKQGIYINDPTKFEGINTINSVAFDSAVVAGDAVYYNAADSKFYKAIDDGSSKSNFVGLADVVNLKVVTSGVVLTSKTFVPGEDVYLSNATAGDITTTVTNTFLGKYLYDGLIKISNVNLTSTAGTIPVKTIGNIENPLCHIPLKNGLSFAKGVGNLELVSSNTSTYIDRYGVVQRALNGEPRFDSLGLIYEGASTNNIIASDDFSFSSWSSTGTGSIQTNIINGPDGLLSADLIDDNDLTADLFSISQTISIPNDSTNHTLSIFLKEGTALATGLSGLITGTGVDIEVDGVLTWATHTVNIGNLVALADDWYRWDFQVQNNLTGNLNLVYTLYPATRDINKTGSVYAWGAQCENLPFATTYIETQTTTMSRNADVLQLTYANNSPGSNFDMTVICDVVVQGALDDLSAQTLFDIEGQTTIKLSPFDTGGLTPSAYHDSSGTAVQGISLTPNTTERLALKWVQSTKTLTLFKNGLQENSQVLINEVTGTGTKINIGSVGSSEYLYGHISNFRIFDTALTDEEIRIV